MNIERFTPCRDGLEYYNSQPDFEIAWNNCHRGDWMLWMANELDVDNKILTLAKGKCAETVIHLMKDQRSIDAVKSAIDFGNELIDKDQLNAAYTAAGTAYTAAGNTADAAACAAADAADDDDADDAIKENQLKTANICREILTETVMEKLKEQV